MVNCLQKKKRLIVNNLLYATATSQSVYKHKQGLQYRLPDKFFIYYFRSSLTKKSKKTYLCYLCF